MASMFRQRQRVMLASGGPRMVVEHVVQLPGGDQVHCVWHSDGRDHRQVYGEHLLVDDEPDLEVVTVGLPPDLT